MASTPATATGAGSGDTPAGTIELAIPKLRQGSYFPDWLLEPRRRAERAMTAVVAEAYVLGVSTRRVDDLVRPWACRASPDRRDADWMWRNSGIRLHRNDRRKVDTMAKGASSSSQP
jgi:hypothetical protein